MSDYTVEPVRSIAGKLVKGMKAFKTVSKADLLNAWRSHPATTGEPTDDECDAIEACLRRFDGGREGGYVTYPPIAECATGESFRIYRENTFFDEVRRWFTHPNQLDDASIIELVQRMKRKWEDYPPRNDALEEGR